jgi:hypothetical protein
VKTLLALLSILALKATPGRSADLMAAVLPPMESDPETLRRLYGCRSAHPLGVAGLLDRVVFEPDAKAPERIQIWGVFFYDFGGAHTFDKPVSGHLYFSLAKADIERQRKEWMSLKEDEGKGVCFSIRVEEGPFNATVRPGKVADKEPDPYRHGLVRLEKNSKEAARLRPLPLRLSPGYEEDVPAGQVRLEARAIGQGEAKFRFEIETRGWKESSDPVAAEGEIARWTPRLKIEKGELYTWRVRVGDGPAAQTRFWGK